MDSKAGMVSPVHLENVAANKQVRGIASLAAGAGAGILRLESAHGFIFYFLVSLIVGGLLQFIVAKGSPEKFFLNPVKDIWFEEALTGISSFILTWTLFYGLVDA